MTLLLRDSWQVLASPGRVHHAHEVTAEGMNSAPSGLPVTRLLRDGGNRLVREDGVPERTRTSDLQVRNLTLYPLSYGHVR